MRGSAKRKVLIAPGHARGYRSRVTEEPLEPTKEELEVRLAAMEQKLEFLTGTTVYVYLSLLSIKSSAVDEDFGNHMDKLREIVNKLLRADR